MSLECVRALLAEARAPVALTGAGCSAESGVPTFRGPEGLWRTFRPEDLATPEAFENDPLLVWEWYDWRRGLIAGAKPNPGHDALADLERRVSGLTLITQNVDGLHALAGSRQALEIHGSLWRTRCLSCGEIRENRDCPLRPLPPRCPCGGLLRPDVVWFGEALSAGLVDRSIRAIETCDLLVVIGTSSLVQPAASLADSALARGVPVVEINLDPTPLSDRPNYVLRGRSGDLLPLLISGEAGPRNR